MRVQSINQNYPQNVGCVLHTAKSSAPSFQARGTLRGKKLAGEAASVVAQELEAVFSARNLPARVTPVAGKGTNSIDVLTPYDTDATVIPMIRDFASQRGLECSTSELYAVDGGVF